MPETPSAQSETRIVEKAMLACDRRLGYNVSAYGTPWTGETEDTEFIVQPLVDLATDAVDLIKRLAEMVGAKANGADARAIGKIAREWLAAKEVKDVR